MTTRRDFSDIAQAPVPPPPGPVTVIGGGVMGCGIAVACAVGGRTVRLVDISPAELDLARTDVARRRELLQRRGRIASDQRPEEAIDFTTDLARAARDAAVVFEAVPDVLELKRAVFAQLDAATPATTPLATNSGNLSIDAIAADTRHPERVLGAHWVNPPQIMLPVELVPGEATDPRIVAAVKALLIEVGKSPVVLYRDVPGRIMNHLHFALLNEAIRLVEQGVASPEDIDRAVSFSFIPRMALFGTLGAHDLFGRQRTVVRTLEEFYEITGDAWYRPTALQEQKAQLEDAGDAAGSRWRPDSPARLLTREERDGMVADLVDWLAGRWSGGDRAELSPSRPTTGQD